jgi:hypothetical protein
MNLTEVYQRLAIPPNLAEHMKTVRLIVEWIEKHWEGEKLNWEQIKTAASLHDLGNIVKFDFEKHPEFLGAEAERIEYWKEKQSEVVEKYGKDDHEVTEKMLVEIGADEEVIKIIGGKSFANSVEIAKMESWGPKILRYADLRTSPNGLVSMKERLDEVTNRLEKYRNDPNLPNLIAACKDIESQIQNKVDADLDKIEV